jgi:hypothetical protein
MEPMSRTPILRYPLLAFGLLIKDEFDLHWGARSRRLRTRSLESGCAVKKEEMWMGIV